MALEVVVVGFGRVVVTGLVVVVVVGEVVVDPLGLVVVVLWSGAPAVMSLVRGMSDSWAALPGVKVSGK